MRDQEQFLHVLDRDEAERRFRRAIDLTPRGAETVPLDAALGRVLAADVVSPVDVPSFDRSNVDGFAVISESTFGASEEAPRTLELGERVVDAGSGAGFDSFVAAHQVGSSGRVVGVDMTAEMLKKARETADVLGAANVEFRDGVLEAMPVEDGWADVVISNGVFNLCPDKRAVFREVRRVLRPGGHLQFADIANGRPVPEAALRDIDLWTG